MTSKGATNAKKLAAQQLGAAGEAAAAAWYERDGYTIVARNWRCFEGEIDIIAQRGRSLVVCEVKARSSGRFMDPTLSISLKKQMRVRSAAHRWLESNPHQGRLRFDVALITSQKIQVIEGAF